MPNAARSRSNTLPVASSTHRLPAGGPVAALHDHIAERFGIADAQLAKWQVDAQLTDRSMAIGIPQMLAGAGGVLAGAAVIAMLLV